MTQVLNQGSNTLHQSPVKSLAGSLIATLAGMPVKILIGLVHLYKVVFSSVMPGTCRFSPSCSCYAIGALKNHGVIRGGYLTIGRLLRCNPWGSWGHDPVPPAR